MHEISWRVERAAQNPIVHSAMWSGLGHNINGPSVIRVPDWVDEPLGRYYLYFADHRGDHIKLAYAEHPEGPWTIHRAGALHLSNSGFPTRVDELVPPREFASDVATGELRPHIASPDVHVDSSRRRILMYFHGLEKDCTQTTSLCESKDGLLFGTARPTGAEYYVRAFTVNDTTYAFALGGHLYRSNDGGTHFATMRRIGDPHTRHVAVFTHDENLFLVYSRIGDKPERLLISHLQRTGDWENWSLSRPVDLLRPDMSWEGADEPDLASRAGAVDEPVRQLRDPAILIDEAGTWLYYACAGESGIAVARLHAD